MVNRHAAPGHCWQRVHNLRCRSGCRAFHAPILNITRKARLGPAVFRRDRSESAQAATPERSKSAKPPMSDAIPLSASRLAGNSLVNSRIFFLNACSWDEDECLFMNSEIFISSAASRAPERSDLVQIHRCEIIGEKLAVLGRMVDHATLRNIR